MTDRIRCAQCERIHLAASRYRMRSARHDLDSSYPRCDLHWRFVCDTCGRGRHFNGMAWCPATHKFLCIRCAPRHRVVRKPFWRWEYYYALACPYGRHEHAALDRLEYERRHPWQRSSSLARRRRGLSPEEDIVPPFIWTVLPLDADISDRRIAAQWDAFADAWSSQFTERGDHHRRYVIDPTLFRILGDVRGLRVFDAGCGNGYLSRLLAKRGAKVEGQDISKRFVAIAREREGREPLGIGYRRGSLADLSAYPNGRFDLVVSQLVLQDVRDYGKAIREIARILRRGGRFVFSIMHPAFSSPPVRGRIQEPRDSNRKEDRLYWKVDRYFDRTAERGNLVLDSPLPLTSFHRPLRDYFEALTDAGFLVGRLEEPVPSRAVVEERPWYFMDEYRVPLFMIIEAVKAS